MLTLYHSPNSRSSRIVRLIAELDIWDQIDIRIVTIPRQDGSGGIDPANPHPEGKVPLLVHDGVEIWESSAIILYLTDMFPQKPMGTPAGDPLRGRYLSWLAWYGNVVEPVIVCTVAQLSHPVLTATFRGIPETTARLAAALEDAPYLMGENFGAADLLLVSPFTWMPDLIPDHPAVRDWIARCEARESAQTLAAYDAKAMAPA